ncbi:MAG: hypothetical protein ACREJP_00980, partial [Candidatus Methylomirabilales bacterium]
LSEVVAPCAPVDGRSDVMPPVQPIPVTPNGLPALGLQLCNTGFTPDSMLLCPFESPNPKQFSVTLRVLDEA